MLQKHYRRLKEALPEEGSIRCLEVTEKQYAQMQCLLGEVPVKEEKINAKQLLVF